MRPDLRQGRKRVGLVGCDKKLTNFMMNKVGPEMYIMHGFEIAIVVVETSKTLTLWKACK